MVDVVTRTPVDTRWIFIHKT